MQLPSLPDSIHNELIDCLTILDNLGLNWAPPTLDDLLQTVVSWEWALCAAITWDAKKDKGRLTAAFTTVAPTLDRWPTPKLIIQHLPPRPLPPALPKPKAVPCPPHIAEQLAKLTNSMVK